MLGAEKPLDIAFAPVTNAEYALFDSDFRFCEGEENFPVVNVTNGDAPDFFIYDSIKILILLFVISAIMGIINAYLPVSKLKNYLQTHKLYGLQYLLASVFVAKGIPIGTSIAFMMGVVGLSIPEATLLKKVMTWKLVGIFFTVVTVCIISGYLFNIIL